MSNKIKVLIVDDSALVRGVLREIFEADPQLQVVGTANDPYAAALRLRTVVPDVIVLDVEMPKMDGITFLRKLMRQHPIPTVICSTLVAEHCEAALMALEAGAVELIAKPTVGTKQFLAEASSRLCDAIKAASKARMKKAPLGERHRSEPKRTADAVVSKPTPAPIMTTQRVAAIGASTGGTEALHTVLGHLPRNCPGLVVVQHMPEGFTATFARGLNDTCTIEVKEAADGDPVLEGRALIARGDHHLLLERSGTRYHVRLNRGPLVSRHRPSVDVLFRSVAAAAGRNAIGVIMTGMGDDGAQGILEMHEAGAHTIAQDEETSVVYGMPAEAVKRGGVHQILPLERIADTVVDQAMTSAGREAR